MIKKFVTFSFSLQCGNPSMGGSGQFSSSLIWSSTEKDNSLFALSEMLYSLKCIHLVIKFSKFQLFQSPISDIIRVLEEIVLISC